MKKETIEKGVSIIREIGFLTDRSDRLVSKKKEIEDQGYIKIDSDMWDGIQIPFEVFEKWFDDEVKKSLDRVETLKKELDEL